MIIYENGEQIEVEAVTIYEAGQVVEIEASRMDATMEAK